MAQDRSPQAGGPGGSAIAAPTLDEKIEAFITKKIDEAFAEARGSIIQAADRAAAAGVEVAKALDVMEKRSQATSIEVAKFAGRIETVELKADQHANDVRSLTESVVAQAENNKVRDTKMLELEEKLDGAKATADKAAREIGDHAYAQALSAGGGQGS